MARPAALTSPVAEALGGGGAEVASRGAHGGRKQPLFAWFLQNFPLRVQKMTQIIPGYSFFILAGTKAEIAGARAQPPRSPSPGSPTTAITGALAAHTAAAAAAAGVAAENAGTRKGLLQILQ